MAKKTKAAKAAKGCGVQTIRFKTKRGRAVEFKGRPGGQTSSGGDCAPKRRNFSRSARLMQGAIRTAAKKCSGKVGSRQRTACVKDVINAVKGEHRGVFARGE
jgi:hypothetical protein